MDKNNTRFYEIDFLRFVAAVAVVLFHYMYSGYVESGYNPISYAPFDNYAQYGYLGVHLFFMISGFVILLTAMKGEAVPFVISRMVRLYPAFWASVTFTSLMIIFFGGELFSVTFLQYFSNLSMIDGFLGVDPVDGVYWTLLVELKFYALIFIILVAKKIKYIDWFLAGWLAIQVIDVFAPLPRLMHAVFFPEWGPYFVSGALFYLLKLHGLRWKYLGLLSISFAFSLYLTGNELVERALYDNSISNYNPIVPIVIVALFHFIFALIITNKLTLFRSAWVIKVGALTYPLYLIHQNVGFIFFNLFDGVINKYLLLVAVLAFVLIVAWLIHNLIEKNLSFVLKKFLNQIEYKAKSITRNI